MTLAQIRKKYGVPAKRKGLVFYRYQRRYGRITGSRNGYIRIRLDGEVHTMQYHPTWCLDYLDGNGRFLFRSPQDTEIEQELRETIHFVTDSNDELVYRCKHGRPARHFALWDLARVERSEDRLGVVTFDIYTKNGDHFCPQSDAFDVSEFEAFFQRSRIS